MKGSRWVNSLGGMNLQLLAFADNIRLLRKCLGGRVVSVSFARGSQQGKLKIRLRIVWRVRGER